jgi:hypothetical protein
MTEAAGSDAGRLQHRKAEDLIRAGGRLNSGRTAHTLQGVRQVPRPGG